MADTYTSPKRYEKALEEIEKFLSKNAIDVDHVVVTITPDLL